MGTVWDGPCPALHLHIYLFTGHVRVAALMGVVGIIKSWISIRRRCSWRLAFGHQVPVSDITLTWCPGLPVVGAIRESPRRLLPQPPPPTRIIRKLASRQ